MSKIISVRVGVLEYTPSIHWAEKTAKQAATIIRIVLESGKEGVSVSWNDSPSATGMARTIESWFASELIGLDILDHPASTEKLFNLVGWHGTSCLAIAAIDNALWDAKAVESGLSLHRLLGNFHAQLPSYAVSRVELSMTSVEPIVEHIALARSEGYHAYKLHLWGDRDRDIAACKQIRDAHGAEFGLMLDPLGRYSITDAVIVGHELERLNFLWFEDPTRGAERHAYPWLAQQLRIPLVATDSLQWSFTDYIDVIDRQCPVVLRLDAGRQGITFCKKVVELANYRGIRCEFHAFGPEANSVLGLHMGLAQRLSSFYEGCIPRRDFEVPGFIVESHLTNTGMVDAPTSEGSGVRADWGYLETNVQWITEGK
jgi:L-alanine-DL-glutamate epimerase-like enolase superfamily enzyme